jgi:hypothetical protein
VEKSTEKQKVKRKENRKMSRTSHKNLLEGCTKGEGWNILTPSELARVQLLYAAKEQQDAIE